MTTKGAFISFIIQDTTACDIKINSQNHVNTVFRKIADEIASVNQACKVQYECADHNIVFKSNAILFIKVCNYIQFRMKCSITKNNSITLKDQGKIFVKKQ